MPDPVLADSAMRALTLSGAEPTRPKVVRPRPARPAPFRSSLGRLGAPAGDSNRSELRQDEMPNRKGRLNGSRADMQFTHLGRSGLSVSRLCLGTMNFAWKTTEPDSFVIMDRSHEFGINFFDTANVYGNARGEGLTEKILGRWFAQGGGASARCWPPRSTGAWAIGQTTRSCRR